MIFFACFSGLELAILSIQMKKRNHVIFYAFGYTRVGKIDEIFCVIAEIFIYCQL